MPTLRLAGLAFVAAALLLSFASNAFASRAYESQLTEANGTPFASPYGLAVDGSDNLWVSDTNLSLVSKFDSSGGFLAQNNGVGSWSGSFFIQSMAYGDTADRAYVADSNNDDVWGLNPDASNASVDLNSGLGSGCCFIGAAVDNSGNANDGDIYVSSSNGSVTRVDGSGAASNFSASGSNQLTSTPDHSFGAVFAVAVDANGDFYALDQGKGEVDRFDSTGTFVHAFTGSFGLLSAVAVDPTNGDVLIGDFGQGVVHEYDASGAFVGDIDGTSTPAGSFTPQGLAVDSTGRLYVADAPNHVVDIFEPNVTPPSKHTLTISCTGSGSGTVTSSPAQGSCVSPHDFDENSTVTLTATPATGSTFTGWIVDGDANACSGTGTCEVAIGTTDHTVVANFDLIPKHTLTVAKTGSGGGSVTSFPVGINCGATCSHDFDEGGTVTLSATHVTGSTFTGWSGPGATNCPGTGTCQVTMPATDTSVSATFAQNKPSVVTTAGATGISQHAAAVAGTVNPNSGNISDCHVEYGTTTLYGTQAPCSPANLGGGASPVATSAALSGLAAGTTYHFRLVAANGGGTTNGADQTFATSADTCESNAALCVPPPPPTCATDPLLCQHPTPGVLKLDVASATVTGATVPVKLSCTGDTSCSDTLKLTAKVKVRKGKKTTTRTLTLGKATIEIAAGSSRTVKIHLNATGRRLLATHRSVKATLAGSHLKHTIALKRRTKSK